MKRLHALSSALSLGKSFASAQTLALDGMWTFAQGNEKGPASPAFDDCGWQTVDAAALYWDQKNLATNSSRCFWLRKKIIIPSSLKNELGKTGALAVYFGKIQEEDEAFFNGKAIGSMANGDIKRAYLLPEKETVWDGENTIALRVLHGSEGGGLSEIPFIAAAKPAQIFIIGSSQTGITAKDPVPDRPLVYHCLVQNRSNKEVTATVIAAYYNDRGKKLKNVSQTALLQPGENRVDFLYRSASPFLKITYTVSIPVYNYVTQWNAELGYQSIRYQPVPFLVATKTKALFTPADAAKQSLTGWLGKRLKANKDLRLYKVDETALLAGYINKPGAHPWIGEHVGKFLEAACNTYKNTPELGLKIQIDRTVQQLIASQLPNGYLGTYDSAGYWASWDVWSHKYNLIGLLAYYQLSGYQPALKAAKKIGDLLSSTFGTAKGQLDIIESGTHAGMAATSVLDPMTDLYRLTGNKAYLAFCYYITSSYDQKNGPKIISTLDAVGRVDKTANAKAYEMLSNLVGLVKLYRLTGDEQFLAPVLTAWKDITENRLYITGTASSKERFQDDHLLPGGVKDNMGEGCVTTTWLQLNYQLFGLSGRMDYLDELERSVYNHLTGAENPQSGCVSYYTPLMGVKPYGCNITCCLSSVPRGIAMIPSFASGKLGGSPSLLFYQPGVYRTALENNTEVAFRTLTDFPEDGTVNITVTPSQTAAFVLLLRKPHWAGDFTLAVNGVQQSLTAGVLQAISRTWKKGDRITVQFTMPVKRIDGGRSYPGTVAFQRGPQVLAFDGALNKASAQNIMVADDASLQKANELLPQGWIGTQAYRVNAEAGGKKQPIVLVPYADAGQTGGEVATWMKRKI